MLGRVSALDGALALLSEASSALLCGFLQDHLVENASDVALIMGICGVVFVAYWLLYHFSGHRACASFESKPSQPYAEDTLLLEGAADRKSVV